MVEDDALKAQPKEGYAKRYNALCERYDSYKKKIDDLTDGKTERVAKAQSIIYFKDCFEKQTEDIKE